MPLFNVKKLVLISIGILFANPSWTQNLIVNPSFEDFTILPDDLGQWNRCVGWNNVSGSFDWPCGSPNYLHTMAGSSLIELPATVFGEIEPYDGNAVMGAVVWHNSTENFREYISQELSEELIVDNCYHLSFQISNGIQDGLELGGSGISELGIYFSVEPPVQIGKDPIDVEPQLIIEEVLYEEAWVQVQFAFTAEAPYKYITIGNFKSDEETEVETNIYPLYISANYFYDAFQLTELYPISINGPMQICEGDTATISAQGDPSIVWADASNPDQIIGEGDTLIVVPDESTTYLAYGIKDTALHMIEVINLSTIDLGPDLLLCEGDSIVFDATLEGSSYLWDDGSTEPMLTVKETGNYNVQLAINDCVFVDSVEVNFVDLEVDLGADQVLCEGNSILLDASFWEGNYTWQDGSSTSTLLVEQGGTYWVEIEAGSCSRRDSVIINERLLPKLDLEGAKAFCMKDEKIIEFEQQILNPNYSIFNNTTNEYTYYLKSTGVYTITAHDEICQYNDSVQLSIYDCENCEIIFPNAFSPNNDGVNDEFRTLANADCPILNHSLVIYDRWGKQVFQSNDINQGWDGSIQGEVAPLGVYVYFAQFELLDKAENHFKQGNVTVIR